MYLVAHPEERSRRLLSHLLIDGGDGAIPSRLLRALARDWPNHHVAVVDGWLLARTEARLCAVLHLKEGARAAGITIARELAGTALRVCLVEGGGLEYEFAESHALYAGTSVGIPMSLQGGRLRFFGGTTNHWARRCAHLNEIDFRRRP